MTLKVELDNGDDVIIKSFGGDAMKVYCENGQLKLKVGQKLRGTME